RVEVSSAPWAPANSGLVQTNFVNVPVVTNLLNGDVYIVPTNLFGFQLASVLLTNSTILSNTIAPAFVGFNSLATNFLGTNVFGTNTLGTNTSFAFTNNTVLVPVTTYSFLAYPIQFGAVSNQVVTSFSNVLAVAFSVDFQPVVNSLG